MLFPKKVKFRKWQKKRTKMEGRVETRGTTVAFGSYGLKTESLHRITSNQIEAARKAASRHLGKMGRMWIRVFPDRPDTNKPAEVPMGGGKGDLNGYTMEVLPGRIIFEVDGVPEATAREALRKAGTKLPLKTRVVSRS
jgi:large subunit ribosomal protein L16